MISIYFGNFHMRAISVMATCLWVLVFTSNAGAEKTGDPFPRVALSYILKVNGKTLWAHRPNRKLPCASLTKVMTALLVLEQGKLEDIVTISPAAAKETGTRIGLRKGESMQVGYLLAATLIMSANDACRSLAEHIGGSEHGFVALMNRRAKELDMKETHFSNACGHDHPELYSTAHDLTILAEAALKNRIFSEYVKSVYAHITTADGRSFYLENKNELIGRYPGAIGVKSGYTPEAGKCLIALAERDDIQVLLVLLNAPNRWWDSETVLNEAFSFVRTADKKP